MTSLDYPGTGTIIASLYLINEQRRQESLLDTTLLKNYIYKYTLRFRSLSLEMLFDAELKNFYYYKTDDFHDLCVKCIAFDDIILEPIIADKKSMDRRFIKKGKRNSFNFNN